MNAALTLDKAVVSLLMSDPFFATLLLRMKRVECGPEIAEYMAADGKTLHFNPEGISKFTFDELNGVLCHEAMHPAAKHHVRRQKRDPELWNQAADYAINPIVLDSGKVLPKGALIEPAYKGKTAEEIYGILERQQNQQPQSGSGGNQQPQQQQGKSQPQQAPSTPGGFGQVLDAPAEEAADQEQEWQMAVEQAAAAARAAGKLPGHLKRLVEELREAKLNWREILRAFIANTVASDFSWSRPNRRLISQGIYLPRVVKEGLGELVFSLDTSGSITSQVLNEFASEVNTVHQDLKPEKVTVLYHDTEVYESEEFGQGDEIVFNPKGGGGTDFRPVFEFIDQQGTQPKCLIMLTDLYGAFPTEAPDYPVLWVSTSKEIAPFGETVRLGI